MRSNRARLVLGGLLSLSVGAAAESPSVAQVLAACERGERQGGLGVDAAICEWYLAPCDCGSKRIADNPDAPWCIPAGTSMDAQVGAVRAALAAAPDLAAPIGPAVQRVLRRRYPCPAP